MYKRIMAAVALLMIFMLALCAGALAESVEAAEAVEQDQEMSDLTGYIIILHTNGAQGYVNDNLGYSLVAFARDRFEEAGAAVLLLDAGNALHGQSVATLPRGESIVRLMNEAGYDAMAPGESEFYYGSERLLELRDAADFDLLSANVAWAATGEGLLEGWKVIEKDGVRFGLLALTAPDAVDKADPALVQGIGVSDAAEAAQGAVNALREQGVDVVIALAPMGLNGEGQPLAEEVASQVDGIDILLDDRAALAEGIWTENGTLIASAGERIASIGCVAISPTGQCAAVLMDETWFAPEDGDAGMDTLIGEIGAAQDALLSEVTFQLETALDGAAESTNAQETALGDLAADALRTATGADIALIGGGEILASLPAGDVTRGQVLALFPAGRRAVTINLTGAELTAALEKAFAAWPEKSDAFLQVSGVSLQFDGAGEVGSRVTQILIGEAPIEAEKSYVVAVSDFFAGELGKPAVHVYGTLEELMSAYVAELEQPVAVEPGARITQADDVGGEDGTDN